MVDFRRTDHIYIYMYIQCIILVAFISMFDEFAINIRMLQTYEV